MNTWSYEFSCAKTLYEMEKLLLDAGIWRWQVRDCAWYPDFLQAYPGNQVRICIYQVKGHQYRTSIEIAGTSNETRPEIDAKLRASLEKLPAQHLAEVEPEEWPFD